MFFNISLNTSDLAETLAVIFQRVKMRVSQLVNLDDEEDQGSIPLVLDVKELKLGSPAEEVALDVKQRLQLLFEFKPSTNYSSEVTKISNRVLRSASKKMATIVEDLQEDMQSVHSFKQNVESILSGQIGGDNSDSDLDEELPPIEISRSQSVPTSLP